MHAIAAGNMSIFTFLLHDKRTQVDARCALGRSALDMAEKVNTYDTARTRKWKAAAAGVLRQHMRGGVVPLPPPAAVNQTFFAAARDGDVACIERLTAEHKVPRYIHVYLGMDRGA